MYARSTCTTYQLDFQFPCTCTCLSETYVGTDPNACTCVCVVFAHITEQCVSVEETLELCFTCTCTYMYVFNVRAALLLIHAFTYCVHYSILTGS